MNGIYTVDGYEWCADICLIRLKTRNKVFTTPYSNVKCLRGGERYDHPDHRAHEEFLQFIIHMHPDFRYDFVLNYAQHRLSHSERYLGKNGLSVGNKMRNKYVWSIVEMIADALRSYGKSTGIIPLGYSESSTSDDLPF